MSEFECVYFILLSRGARRITVVFRGSSTITDWVMNFQNAAYSRPNPIDEDYEGKLDNIEIMKGYYIYLLARRLDTHRSKFDEIADKAYEYGQELGPDFTLCCTGHSMGGALASLFSFYCSVDQRFKNRPIRLFTFGGSFCGRTSYAKAFQHQERVGRIMHCRIESYKDPVPYTRLSPQLNYAQTGVGVRLYGYSLKRKPYFFYIHQVNWWSSLWANIVTNVLLIIPWLMVWKVLDYHKVNSYVKSLHAQGMALREHDEEMAAMSLEDLYTRFVYVNEKNGAGNCPSRREKYLSV